MKIIIQHLIKLILLAMTLGVVGCFPLLTGASKTQTLYVLSATKCEEPEITSIPQKVSQSKASIFLTAPKASAFIYSSRIIFSKDEKTRGSYQYAYWTEPPPDRIALALENQLRCSGQIAKVSRNTFPADYLVRFELIDFRHDISSNPGEVVVVSSVEILDARDGSLIDKREHSEKIAATSFDAEGAVAAFNQAVALTVQDMTEWLVLVTQSPRKKGTP